MSANYIQQQTGKKNLTNSYSKQKGHPFWNSPFAYKY